MLFSAMSLREPCMVDVFQLECPLEGLTGSFLMYIINAYSSVHACLTVADKRLMLLLPQGGSGTSSTCCLQQKLAIGTII